jgi:phage recombination protein Bet
MSPKDEKSMALAIRESSSLFEGWTMEQVELVGRTVAPDLNVQELALYLAVARRADLDPFSGQLYAFVNKKDRLCIGASIDGLRAKADETGNYAPGPKPEFKFDKKGNLKSCEAYVQKYVNGHWMLVSAEVDFGEWRRSGPNWEGKPKHMLAKCAEALALRKAFPRQIGGSMSEGELVDLAADSGGRNLDKPDAIETTCEVIDQPLAAGDDDQADGFRIGGHVLDLSKASVSAWITAAAEDAGLNPDEAAIVIRRAKDALAIPETREECEERHIKLLVEMFERAASARQAAQAPTAPPPHPAPPTEPAAPAPPEVTDVLDANPSPDFIEACTRAGEWGATPEQLAFARRRAFLASTPASSWQNEDRLSFLNHLQIVMEPAEEAPGSDHE